MAAMLVLTDENLQREEAVILYESVNCKKNETTWKILLPLLKRLKIDTHIISGLMHVVSDQALESLFKQRCDIRNNQICIFHNYNR